MSNLDDIFDAPKEKQEQPQPFDISRITNTAAVCLLPSIS